MELEAERSVLSSVLTGPEGTVGYGALGGDSFNPETPVPSAVGRGG